LPLVDVEGAALHRKVEFQRWELHHGETVLLAHELVVLPGSEPVQLSLAPGSVAQLGVPRTAERHALGLALVGRGKPVSGELVVGGCLLPEQRGSVQRIATLVDAAPDNPVVSDVEEPIARRSRLVAVSPQQRKEFVARARNAVEELATATSAGAPRSHVVDSALAVAGGARVLVLMAEYGTADAESLTAALGRLGITVVVLDGQIRAVQPAAVSQPVAAATEEEWS
jgi:RND superfamily putative drug exporter